MRASHSRCDDSPKKVGSLQSTHRLVGHRDPQRARFRRKTLNQVQTEQGMLQLATVLQYFAELLLQGNITHISTASVVS